ncbi:hypothetical protein [Hoeflea sp. AS16]|uniref:hypothetical protein n=1 Tax=Hoeflea sp. AS16 TaxID=3135779 RepID=UPI00316CE942
MIDLYHPLLEMVLVLTLKDAGAIEHGLFDQFAAPRTHSETTRSLVPFFIGAA